MRIAEYKQISTRTEQRVIRHDAEYDEDGNITTEALDETVEVQVPVMGTVYRDVTTDELAEMERQQSETSGTVSTPAEQREIAYNTLPCVEWDGDMLTVTEAAQRWAYYAAEGNADKTDALTALIAAAKAEIRAKYPDNAGGT